jgi:hypothetical protein
MRFSWKTKRWSEETDITSKSTFYKLLIFFLISKPIKLDILYILIVEGILAKKVNGFWLMKMEKKSATLKKLLDEKKRKRNCDQLKLFLPQMESCQIYVMRIE